MTSSVTDVTHAGRPGYYAPPHSIDPLPRQIHYGLIVVGICGLASFLSTLTLFSFLMYRFLTWRAHYKTFIGYNQYIVLFLNLVFADLLQATAFVISFYWIAKDAILAPTHACTSQGFLLHFGDVASAFFVLSISVHTYATAARNKRIHYTKFAIAIGITWLLALFLTVLGLALHGKKYFVRAGAWCWVSNDFETERLALHYVWLFLAEFGLVIVYLATFLALRRQTSRTFKGQRDESGNLPNQRTVDTVNRITKLMMIYPLVYIVLTLPLSSSRMWSMAHGGQSVSNITACTLGALLASCGWVDCLLYTLTRKRLLSETMGAMSGRSNTSGIDSKGGGKNTMNSIMQTKTWTVRNHSMDVSHGQRRSFGDGQEVGKTISDNERRSRNKSVGIISETSVERSPSPAGSMDPIVAQERGGMRRMLSDARKEVGLNSAYELRPIPKQVDWRSGV